MKEFEIKNGVLTEYFGPGGDVVIPDGVKEIGEIRLQSEGMVADGEITEEIRRSRANLTSVMIPEGVEKIGSYAFWDCANLTGVVIPESVSEIGERAFLGCPKLANDLGMVIVQGILFDYFGPGGDVTIPESVKSIEKSAFFGCKSLTGIRIPEGVQSIGGEAFDGCANLARAVIPEGVAEIGGFAFKDCKSLADLVIPESVRSIGQRAFENCTGLTDATILGSDVELDKTAFEGCDPALIAPNLPLSAFDKKFKLAALRGFAKLYCDGAPMPEEFRAGYLKYLKGQRKRLYKDAVRFPQLLTVMIQEKMISQDDFDAVWNLAQGQNNVELTAMLLEYRQKQGLKPRDIEQQFERELEILDTGIMTAAEAKKIWRYEKTADGSSIKLTGYKGSDTAVTIPKAIGKQPVTEIGDGTFSPKAPRLTQEIRQSCKNLTSVIIPEGVKKIGGYAFYGCTSLADVVIPESVAEIGSCAFECCESLTSVVIPKSVRSIGERAFYGCESLTSVTIPAGAKSIGKSAFEGCKNLTRAVIPESVAEIGYHAFWNCKNLTIHAPADSRAERYANTYKMKFEALEE